MQSKTNLNNTQRKMLDEAYMEYFDKVIQDETTKLNNEYKVLETKVLKKVTAQNKAVIDEYHKASQKIKKLNEKLEDVGMVVKKGNSYSQITYNELNLFTTDIKHPELVKFKEEAQEKIQILREKKKEVRIKIYGFDSTMSEMKKEIDEYIKL